MSPPRTASATAHGRVNLIGEHTDYHEGYVLPVLIPQTICVELEIRDDRHVRARSALQGGEWEGYELGHETPGRGWLDYIQGVTMVLATDQLNVPGFDLTIHSDVPAGAGLSSSAALLVSILRGLRTAASLPLDDVQIAQTAHRAETTFVGAPVGVMDTLASSLGREREALLLDTRSLKCESIALPASIEVVVIESGITRSNVNGGYGQRRQESFAAATWLGLRVLRDLDPDTLSRSGLPPVLARRARHIVTENARVLEAAEALRDEDGPRLGVLFSDSHASMRDDYEISTPEIDALVAIAQAHPDVYGARLTGGGFGGSIVMVAKHGTGRAAALPIMAKYADFTMCEPRLIV